MDPHETIRPTRPDAPRATAPPTRTFGPQGPTLGDLIDAYLQDYLVRQFRSHSTARGRTAHLTAFFGRAARAAGLTTYQIRQYQLARRAAGAATGTINRETSALHRMGTLAVHWGWLDTVPGFPDRLRENPPRQGFFEHPEYLAVRAHLPAPWQDILDLAYYSLGHHLPPFWKRSAGTRPMTISFHCWSPGMCPRFRCSSTVALAMSYVLTCSARFRSWEARSGSLFPRLRPWMMPERRP